MSIQPIKNPRFVGKNFVHLDAIDSTNTFCLKNDNLLSEPGTVVYADRQYAGRGRMGRRWEQGDGSHLFASFIFHPRLPAELIPSITICAGVAVHRLFSSLGIECSLKWPNDVLVNGRKVCGILCESRITGEHTVVVAGVGINITGGIEQFPPSLGITTLEMCGVKTDRDTLLIELATIFDQALHTIHGPARDSLFREWEQASASIGKKVSFDHGSGRCIGKITGLDHLGRLLVRSADGGIVTVLSGEVQFE